MQYIVHSEPARRPARGYIAMAALERFGFPGQSEQLWLETAADGGLTVACLPFRVYGLALGDGVELTPDGTQVARRTSASGHRVLRVFLALPDAAGLRAELTAAAAGSLTEWSGGRHLALDVPPGGDVSGIDAVVRPHLDGGGAQWEWADAEPFGEWPFGGAR